MPNIEIDGEVFEIEKVKSISPMDDMWRTGYCFKNKRVGVLVCCNSIEQVKESLLKVSKDNKIYANPFYK